MEGRVEGLRAPEGLWRCASERRATTNFSPDFCPRLEIAELAKEEPPKTQTLVLMNTQQALYIYNSQMLDRVRFREAWLCRRRRRRLLPSTALR